MSGQKRSERQQCGWCQARVWHSDREHQQAVQTYEARRLQEVTGRQ